MFLFSLFLIIITFTSTYTAPSNSKPNVVLIVMDDLGYNDVPWHGHTDTKMPFLEEFVENYALKIDSFYAMPLCSMTRSALLTGRYPFRYGLQSSVIENGYPFGLSIFESLLTSDLKSHGYNTYMVGKWHLGFHREDMTPLNRDFDEFRGSLSPMIHYFNYNYKVEYEDNEYDGYDLWINNNKVKYQDTSYQFLTNWESDQFIDIFDNIILSPSYNNNPFFIYLAMHASHDPREATDDCLDLYDVTNCIDLSSEELMDCEQHQIFQSQTSCADIALKQMIQHLQNIDNGNIWDNTLLIWLSDNGAPPWDGDNSPLRGAKKELYEGGIRTPAFISGGYLNSDRYGQTFDVHTPFHVVDLYPTILNAINVPHDIGGALDGVNQWDAIQFDRISDKIKGTKREFLYNVDPYNCFTVMCGAYRYGNYKFLWSQNTAPDQMYWYDYYSTNPRKDEDGNLNEQYTNYLQCDNIPTDIQTKNEYTADGELVGTLPCGDRPCLFNIEEDPCEYNDISQDSIYENLYLYMYNMLMAYYDSQMIALRPHYNDKFDANSSPDLNEDKFWQAWIRDYNKDDNYYDFEDLLMDNRNNDKSQNVKLSTYYTIATQFKKKWEDDVDNGILSNVYIHQDDAVTPYDIDTNDNGFGSTSVNLLIFASVGIAIIVIVGAIVIFIRWRKTCCNKQNNNNESKKIINQIILNNKNKKETTPIFDYKTKTIDTADIDNDNNEMVSFNERLPLLYSEKQ